MMIKNEWREDAKHLIYQAIVIKGYKFKHLSKKYTYGVLPLFFIHIQIECFNGWSSFLWKLVCIWITFYK